MPGVRARARAAAGGAPRGKRGAGGGARSPAEVSWARRGWTQGASSESGAEPGVGTGTGTGTMEEDDSYGQYGPRPGRADAPSPASCHPRPGGAPGGSRLPGRRCWTRVRGPDRAGAPGAGQLRGARVSGRGRRSRGPSRRGRGVWVAGRCHPRRPGGAPRAVSLACAPAAFASLRPLGARKCVPRSTSLSETRRRKRRSGPASPGTILRPSSRGLGCCRGPGPRPRVARAGPVLGCRPRYVVDRPPIPRRRSGKPGGAGTNTRVCALVCAHRQRKLDRN